MKTIFSSIAGSSNAASTCWHTGRIPTGSKNKSLHTQAIDSGHGSNGRQHLEAVRHQLHVHPAEVVQEFAVHVDVKRAVALHHDVAGSGHVDKGKTLVPALHELGQEAHNLSPGDGVDDAHVHEAVRRVSPVSYTHLTLPTT